MLKPSDLIAAVDGVGFRAAVAGVARAQAITEIVRLEVRGMSCASCSGAVERALLKVPGVASATVSAQLGRADVSLSSSSAVVAAAARPLAAAEAAAAAAAASTSSSSSAAATPPLPGAAPPPPLPSPAELITAVEAAGFEARLLSRGPPGRAPDRVLLRARAAWGATTASTSSDTGDAAPPPSLPTPLYQLTAAEASALERALLAVPGVATVDVDAASGRWVVGVEGSPKPPPLRVSLTLPAIASAREILIVAFGAGKGDIVREALVAPGKEGEEAGPSSPLLPVQRVEGARWLIDAAAARGLETK